MTHQTQVTALDQITELLAEHGFNGLAQAVTVLLNEVMKLERSHALGAGPYQRTESRTGYANGFKPNGIKPRPKTGRAAACISRRPPTPWCRTTAPQGGPRCTTGSSTHSACSAKTSRADSTAP